MSKTPKRPKDPNQLAKMMIDIGSGEIQNDNDSELSPMAALGRWAARRAGRRVPKICRQNDARRSPRKLPPRDGKQMADDLRANSIIEKSLNSKLEELAAAT
jgi:hypothetical protein